MSTDVISDDIVGILSFGLLGAVQLSRIRKAFFVCHAPAFPHRASSLVSLIVSAPRLTLSVSALG